MSVKVVIFIISILIIRRLSMVLFYEIKFQKKYKLLDGEVKSFVKTKYSNKYILMAFVSIDGKRVCTKVGPPIKRDAVPELGSTIQVLTVKSSKCDSYVSRLYSKNKSLIIENILINILLILFLIVLDIYMFLV